MQRNTSNLIGLQAPKKVRDVSNTSLHCVYFLITVSDQQTQLCHSVTLKRQWSENILLLEYATTDRPINTSLLCGRQFIKIALITGSWRLFYNCLLEDFLFFAKVDISTSTLADNRKASKDSYKQSSAACGFNMFLKSK